MPTHAEQRVLPYTPEQLYDLVADIERYPEFLPWCRRADPEAGRERRLRRPDHRLQDVPRALHLPGRRSSPPDRIDVAYIEGPFRYLNNHWIFNPNRERWLPDRFLRRFRIPVEACCSKSSACCSTRRCAAWSPPSRPAPGSSTARPGAGRQPQHHVEPRVRHSNRSRAGSDRAWSIK